MHGYCNNVRCVLGSFCCVFVQLSNVHFAVYRFVMLVLNLVYILLCMFMLRVLLVTLFL